MSKDNFIFKEYQKATSYLKIDIEASKNNDSNSGGYKKAVYQSVKQKTNDFSLDKWFLPFCFIFEVVVFHFALALLLPS